jgi:uncharacterized protein (DUF58 family)
MLASMLVSGMTSQYNLRGLTVNLVFPSEIFARKPFIAVVELTNGRRRIPAFFIRVEVMGATSTIMFLKPGESRRIFLQLSFSNRGLYQKLPVIIMSRFPFGFFSRAILVEYVHEIIVYPEPLECDGETIAKPQDLKEEHGSGTQRNMIGWVEEEIVSIRNYQEGDPKKLINWKATAKMGILKVNERALEQPRVFIIDLSDVSRENLEHNLSCATYLTINLVNRGYLVGLKGLDVFIPPQSGSAHLKKLLEVLALYALDEVPA